ncbi:histidine kinase [Allokutzneria sp. A3M-2-11 16]|uniref:sensor histidine kinase n=1 Tax=Allokutzneria sp. A3M-2-11 16 TaxID=2962043 RepID=UPI0020B6CAED|nr:histidine kinase [Allokutzneria sp. A3M-2-11 16]MCP3798275.1 histidine kinase [Allokutzneria sp. A3M-2-11 16]
MRARLHGDRRRLVFGAATAFPAAGVAAGVLAGSAPIAWLSLTVTAFLLGIVARQRLFRSIERRHAEELREQRLQIAADLHDVMGHHLGAISVRTSLLDDLAAGREPEISLAANGIRDSSRAAVTDLGALVARLRGEPGAPEPGIDGVPELVRFAEAAGNEVELRLGDLPEDVPPEIYWVLREALTNVVKHSSPTRVRVRLEVVGGELVAGVGNERCRVDRPRPFPGSGFGVRGMRERVRRLGGRLAAGRVTGGGYQVLAAVPVDRPGVLDRTA